MAFRKKSKKIAAKTPAELDAMQAAGEIVGRTLQAVKAAAKPGVSTLDLDEIAEATIREAGATPAFLGYQGFPGSICSSVNDMVVHGIPAADVVLKEGDLVSIDCGAILDGWASDSAISFVVGTPRQEDLDLIATTTAALEAGIAAAQVGGRLGDISNAIGRVANKARLGNLEDHGGHGIGRVMHGEPFVPNDGRPRRGMELKAGLVLALEPMFILGGSGRYRHGDDGWTLYTRDGSRSAHVEHTVAITADGPRILSAV